MITNKQIKESKNQAIFEELDSNIETLVLKYNKAKEDKDEYEPIYTYKKYGSTLIGMPQNPPKILYSNGGAWRRTMQMNSKSNINN